MVRKLTDQDVAEIQTRFWAGERQRDLAREYGVSTSRVTQLTQRLQVSEEVRRSRRAGGYQPWRAPQGKPLRRPRRKIPDADIPAITAAVNDGAATVQEIAEHYGVPVAAVRRGIEEERAVSRRSS